MPSPKALAISPAEADALFADLIDTKALVLAVSGGPDSTALMVLAARWAKTLARAPVLTVITVDHGLRKESKDEASDVARLAKGLGLAHRTLRWTGQKPETGLPQAARHARYRLLAAAARKAGARHVLTAHTLDDQAETVIIRLLRGSGLTGLAGMKRETVIPGYHEKVDPESTLRSAKGLGSGFAAKTPRPGMTGDEILLLRPFLDIPKARLIATLRDEHITFADDPTNRDPQFTRARLRGLMPQLAEEGLDAARLALLAQRLTRAETALAVATGAAEEIITVESSPYKVVYDSGKYSVVSDEIALRLLGQAIAAVGDEGPVELAKLEVMKTALQSALNSGTSFRRSLAGALVTLSQEQIIVERAPARAKVGLKSRPNALTKDRPPRAKRPKRR